jgi:hypothetical protein
MQGGGSQSHCRGSLTCRGKISETTIQITPEMEKALQAA